jgi:hypothetical protein
MMTYLCNTWVPLPQVRIAADLTDEEKSVGLQSPTHILLYVETIKLYHLLGKVVTEIYKPYPNSMQSRSSASYRQTEGGDIEAILTMDDHLEKFQNEISRLLHWKKGQRLRAALPEMARSVV